MKRRELETQLAKASSILQDKVAAWNIVERQLKVGRLQLKRQFVRNRFIKASMFYECVLEQYV